MAKGFFRARCAALGCEVTVASAGSLGEGVGPPEEVIEVMAHRDIDISTHCSRLLSPELVRAADVVVGMARQHLIEVITLAPDAWERCFTLVDLVRRGEAMGRREESDELAAWVRRVQGGRSRSSLLALDLGDDIDDPMGGRPVVFERVADRLDDLVTRLATLLCPPVDLRYPPTSNRPTS